MAITLNEVLQAVVDATVRAERAEARVRELEKQIKESEKDKQPS